MRRKGTLLMSRPLATAVGFLMGRGAGGWTMLASLFPGEPPSSALVLNREDLLNA